MNPMLQTEENDPLTQHTLLLGDTVHLEGGGSWASGTIDQLDADTLGVRLVDASGDIARQAAGTLFELQRGVEGGVLITQVPLVGYDEASRVLRLRPPVGTLQVERREHSRVQVRIRACLFHDKRALPEVGWTVNLAGGGVALELAESELAVGDPCDIWLRIPDGAPVQVRARLLATAPCHRFEFWHLDPVHEERLLRFLLKEEAHQRRLRLGAR